MTYTPRRGPDGGSGGHASLQGRWRSLLRASDHCATPIKVVNSGAQSRIILPTVWILFQHRWHKLDPMGTERQTLMTLIFGSSSALGMNNHNFGARPSWYGIGRAHVMQIADGN